MGVLSALVFFVGMRVWSERLPVLNLPALPLLRHQPVIQVAPVQPWGAPVVAPLIVAPDLRCSNYVQGADGQRHCYVKQSP